MVFNKHLKHENLLLVLINSSKTAFDMVLKVSPVVSNTLQYVAETILAWISHLGHSKKTS